jgi:RsiW-degrading membrane proteinase PrsW (M82 family)
MLLSNLIELDIDRTELDNKNSNIRNLIYLLSNIMSNPVFTEVKANLDISQGKNWMMMLKFWGINLVVGLVVVLIVSILIKTFVIAGASTGDDLGGVVKGALGGGIIALLPALLIVVAGQIYILNWFKESEGCYTKQ